MQLTKTLLHTTDTYIKKLSDAGIHTVEDILGYYPREIEMLGWVITQFVYLSPQEVSQIEWRVISISQERSRNGKLITKLILEDTQKNYLESIFFHAPYQLKSIKKGESIRLIGRPKYEYGKMSLISPEVQKPQAYSQELRPIYSDINYIPGVWFAQKIPFLLDYIQLLNDPLPKDFPAYPYYLPFHNAIRAIHTPSSSEEFEQARESLGYRELFVFQQKWVERKLKLQESSNGRSLSIAVNPEYIRELLSRIPFTLTDKQKISLFQILKDMENSHSMHRLLQGDVGTGKTLVAFLSALHILHHSGAQVVCMAPTEILARQHLAGFQRYFWDLGFTSDLLVWGLSNKEKARVKHELKSGSIRIIFGTHALIQEDVIYKDLGFVIIDEQHRFGVNERKALEEYASHDKGGNFPHVLNMTATPIPRTLTLTIHGDQDLSVINEYPRNRKSIHTTIVGAGHKSEMYRFVDTEVQAGRQVYWVCPLVEESDTLDIANATQKSEELRDIFQSHHVGLLHGKMKAKDKDMIMQAFLKGEIDILTSTSVIEVWVDNPNATIIVIEGAERFGLSQLHQFRGRVGRWEHQSYCYLLTSEDKRAGDRLKIMEESNDGFVLSEKDLEIRGPGEVYGIRQSGVPDFKLASLNDSALISSIREDLLEYYRLSWTKS